MRIPPIESIPGEWQIEKTPYGIKRYRMIGNIKEYESTITIDGCEVPESQVEAFRKHRQEAKAAEKERFNREEAEKPKVSCPFADGININCKGKDCALYHDKSCTLTRITDKPPIKATMGLKCPFKNGGRVCHDKCALYKNGCILTAIITEREDH